MSAFIERRKYRRFEIPEGDVRHKRTALPTFFKHFSKPYPVLNAGIGGLAILCEDDFNVGEDVILKLSAPDETPLNLFATAIWQGPVAISSDMIIGFEFMPVSHEKGNNSPDTLNILRRLYARYITDKK